MAEFLEDALGNIYMEMDDELRDSFPDKIQVEYDGRKIVFYLEPRLYLPNVGEEEHAVDVNSVMGMRYATGHFMAENAEELTDDTSEN